ncbi:hypothetical protein CDL12_23330 [Handroanthus impetiginosus]|uniref:Uncharacterized protein n=1 Tax=Handroanthus impetiginosus TaxID=429701 RepID=A0A2G9GFS1_9LAMI|nr:hypothetical protein CDL12_23330 [Handroanthus impetiginosus]
MRKISGRILSSKPVSLSRAAKLMTRFAAVENGASPAVSVYLQRTAEAFNHLVQLHSKRPKISEAENSPDRKGVQKLQTESVEGKEAKDSKRKLESDRETGEAVAEANPYGDEVKDVNSEEKEKKKNKKKQKKEKSDGDDSKETRNSKKRRVEGHES